ncbi:hypothetical protein PM082_022651 [Marasmius tenuissimus]|nr:hypothetical protein PM082_021971 [Marasmius tenuissimus]KAJ8089519.1 hypothetical protein PM082_014775 [Marasmius tenuissimus]KAJ8096078.1 hypothetical protein PM082_022651 [Marasmius tenuissimus]
MSQEEYYESFFSQRVPVPPAEIIDSTTYSWLANETGPLWTNEMISSPEFSCGGHNWKILLALFEGASPPPGLFAEPLPEARGNITVVSLARTSSIATAGDNEDSNACFVQFAIMMASEMDPSLWICDQKIRRFAGTDDWGFARTGVLRALEVTGRQNNPDHELGLRITVHVRVLGRLSNNDEE